MDLSECTHDNDSRIYDQNKQGLNALTKSMMTKKCLREMGKGMSYYMVLSEWRDCNTRQYDQNGI